MEMFPHVKKLGIHGNPPTCIACLNEVELGEYLKNDHTCNACKDKNPIGRRTDSPLCAKILEDNRRCDIPESMHLSIMDHKFKVRDNK